jgi:hypothetical protein
MGFHPEVVVGKLLQKIEGKIVINKRRDNAQSRTKNRIHKRENKHIKQDKRLKNIKKINRVIRR